MLVNLVNLVGVGGLKIFFMVGSLKCCLTGLGWWGLGLKFFFTWWVHENPNFSECWVLKCIRFSKCHIWCWGHEIKNEHSRIPFQSV